MRSDREKLVALMREVGACICNLCVGGEGRFNHSAGILADHLLANGVVVREKGEWEWYVEPRGYFTAYDEDFGYRCPKCKVYAREWGADDDIFEEPPLHIHFCPNCGADMTGGDRNV